MKAYADANFFTRLYYLMEDSPTVARLLSLLPPESAKLPIPWLLEVEITNALELHVFVSKSAGQSPMVTPEFAAAAQANFLADLEAGEFLERVEFPTGRLKQECINLSLRHTAKSGYRTYDLIHVATALMLSCDHFWSFDRKACQLAAAEGLVVELAL